LSDRLLSELIDLIPESQRERSGGAFYSGRAAWVKPSRIYLIGYNPGGNASDPGTVMDHTEMILRHDRYSAFVTEGNPVNEPRWGTSMQASVRHVLGSLGYNPNLVPASNLFFARSSRADHHPEELTQQWKEECWELHEHVIKTLDIEIVMCIGKATADFVLSRDVFSQHEKTNESFTSTKGLPRTSQMYDGPGVRLVQLGHTSSTSWLGVERDPSPYIHDWCANDGD
jgi:hypothetical protein